mmetsp:Transcript_24236/g.96142  ORF Transcript_24236/g.96142 Transcript_24236/m.96142 type:complete len:225 (+) Transcript_24236:259-933(+)
MPGVAYQRRRLRRPMRSGWSGPSGPMRPDGGSSVGVSASAAATGSSHRSLRSASESSRRVSSHATTAALKQKPGNGKTSCTVTRSWAKTGRRGSPAVAENANAPAVQWTYVVDAVSAVVQGSSSSVPSANLSASPSIASTRPRPRMAAGAQARKALTSSRFSVASMNLRGAASSLSRYTRPSRSSRWKPRARISSRHVSFEADGVSSLTTTSSSAAARSSIEVI